MSDVKISTTDTGAPAPSDEFSLSVGADGPILLHDFHFVNQMAHFNRERVPERNVHAKGAGAFGVFETTEDVSEYTKAALFQPGVTTDMLARFSTVAGEQGSADTVRDPRGFALKFYTTEGNYDLVGNNTPIFFIRDTMKFPHFIRTQKRLPDSGLQDWDMRWDFWTQQPESAHQVTYLMGDRGIPKTWRHMHGFGSHTFMWINAEGKKSWVKYHFLTDQGIENLTNEEAAATAAADPDAHRRDLFQSIKEGTFPSWTLHVQVIPYEDAKTYKVNPFDLTKTISHADYPLIKVGRMTLNRNPENFFAQIEQAAFEPSAVVPGIGFSPDKMLLGRVFAYADTHRYRIGPNYLQVPVNRPQVDVNTYEFDGPMRYGFTPGQPVYSPNTKGGPAVAPNAADPTWEVDGEMIRSAYTLHPEDDDFSQAGTLVREVMDEA
ncbi:MAG: catalase, partial [Propionibacteriaceae bacterium]